MRGSARIWAGAIIAAGLLVGSLPADATPIQDLDDLLNDVTDDAGLRRRLTRIRALADSGNQAGAVALADVVRRAGHGKLRVEAARALGKIETKRAAGLLVELLAVGNTRDTRAELSRSLAKQSNGVEKLVVRLTAKRDDELGKRLVVAGLRHDVGPNGRRALERFVLADDESFRVPAMRALSLQREARTMTHAITGIVLAEREDIDTLVYAMDALSDAPIAGLEEHALRFADLAQHPNSAVKRRAEYLEKRLTYLKEKDEYDRTKDTRYAKRGSEPTEPRFGRTPVDVIYAFETTYSSGGGLRHVRGRISEDIHQAQRLGIDLRVGFIAYRDHLRDENQRRTGYVTRATPLTFDIQKAIAWASSLGAGGVDTQGLAISNTLRVGFARMNWRWEAERRFHLIGGRLIDRPTDAKRIAKLHTRSDRTGLMFYGAQSKQNLEFARAVGIDVGTWR